MISATLPSSILRTIASAVSARRYVIAGVCLLIVAVSLRFYNLSDNSLRFDEAKAALNSGGAFSEVLLYTRDESASPILYPLALWAVQKAASTDFSVRFMPAAGSALTVAALLFLMPRVGVPQRAAFLAALLAALSAVAIEHAQDAREYSLDALCAALMIAGLLQYRRNGGKALLCGALFVGPLLQYGLVLFGVAVIGVALLAPSASSASVAGGGWRTGVAAIWGRLRPRLGLLLPIALFAAACAITWLLTARYQWPFDARWGYAYLEDYYYRVGFDATSMAGFAVNRIWELLTYHMPPIAAVAALLAAEGLLAAWALRQFRGINAVALLCAFALGVALCAALTGVYPLGDIRQCLYLGPLIFLALGGAFHSLIGAAAAALRRRWVAPALTAAVVGIVALVGANDIRQRDLRNSPENYIKGIISILDERAQEGDAVYVSQWGVPLAAFYKKQRPDNYFYGEVVCWESSGRGCVSAVFDEMFGELSAAPRIWMIHTASVETREALEKRSSDIRVEEVVSRGGTTLHLITGYEEIAADVAESGLAMNEPAPAATPAPAAVPPPYNLHIQDHTLHYSKQPCAPLDTEARFFLHLYPRDVNDLPDNRQKYGFDNLDFDFQDHGSLADNRCDIRRALPDYPIKRIDTGQFIWDASTSRGWDIWEVEIPYNP